MTTIRNYVQEKKQQSTNLLPHFELAIISLMWPITLKGELLSINKNPTNSVGTGIKLKQYF